MKMMEMNNEERILWESLPQDMREVAHVTNSYQNTLETVQSHMRTLIGSRADWRRCLDQYFESAEYRNECHEVEAVSDIPELTKFDIQQMIDLEDNDSAIIGELKTLRQQYAMEGSRAAHFERVNRMTNILGILPESRNGLNQWFTDYSCLTLAEKA